MSECDCPYCGRAVTANDQYMIEHELGFHGDVVHKVYHIACLETKPSRSGGLPTESDTADHESRSKQEGGH